MRGTMAWDPLGLNREELWKQWNAAEQSAHENPNLSHSYMHHSYMHINRNRYQGPEPQGVDFRA